MMQELDTGLPGFGTLPDGVLAALVPLELSGMAGFPLPPEEEASIARLRTAPLQDARRAVLTARRLQLAEWTGEAPEALHLGKTGEGAPVMIHPQGWTVSFSDADRVAAMAAAPGWRALGIDVVRAGPRDWRAMLNMVCAPDEAAAFLAKWTRENEAATAFNRMWAIKEAALKAGGRGMRAGAKTVRVRIGWLEGPAAFELSLSGRVLEGVSVEAGGVFACLVAGPVTRPA
ncbi:4'-phosphopantetheinyl transferase family protein [Hyphomonas sp.]|uniref:4'-phosphopantetheinyl transferase family protein n=1 Tax=Hyphomonas sp. TaxID=87 RepID=UPI00391BE1B0